MLIIYFFAHDILNHITNYLVLLIFVEFKYVN